MSRSRQVRLVGDAAQRALEAATVRLAGRGFARWVEERYVRGAGVTRLGDAVAAASGGLARGGADAPDGDERFADLEPEAREVALGAARALDAIRRVIAG